MVISVALYDEETARGRVSIHRTSDSEGVCDADSEVGGNDDDGGGDESSLVEDDTAFAERGGGGENNIIQWQSDRTIKKREN